MTDDPFNTWLYYRQYKLTVYNNLFVGIVYGVYIVLYVASVQILLKDDARLQMFMFGTTTFMFILGIIVLVLETAFGFQQMQLFLYSTDDNVWPIAWPSGRIGAVFIVVETIRRLMYILSDIICAWRAVVLWNRDKRVIAILLLFIFGTTVAAACEIGLKVVPISDLSNFIPPSMTGTLPFTSYAAPLIMVGPTLGTNLVSTGLIAWKAWQHRISVKRHLGKGTGFVRADRVFALLIDSGFIYCCLWFLFRDSTTVQDRSSFLGEIYETQGNVVSGEWVRSPSAAPSPSVRYVIQILIPTSHASSPSNPSVVRECTSLDSNPESITRAVPCKARGGAFAHCTTSPPLISVFDVIHYPGLTVMDNVLLFVSSSSSPCRRAQSNITRPTRPEWSFNSDTGNFTSPPFRVYPSPATHTIVYTRGHGWNLGGGEKFYSDEVTKVTHSVHKVKCYIRFCTPRRTKI
ncbi:hypothetical protein H4582DRAFT_2056943 [Lactarius indigo]|nr:hypothetical protein H4582DRAFT_2056943 [Lactarius indigo]